MFNHSSFLILGFSLLNFANSNAIEMDYTKGIVPFDESPFAKDLTMNHVPVYDQDQYGRAETFADTAATLALVQGETCQNLQLSKNDLSIVTTDTIATELDKGRRIVLKFLLDGKNGPISIQGFDIVVNGQNYKGGLWACRQINLKNYCGYGSAGHVAVVYGYDKNQKLFKLRNSWGVGSGHNGDFYMTEDFLNTMSVEATSYDKICLLNGKQ